MKEMRLHVHSMNKHLSMDYLNKLSYWDLEPMTHPNDRERFKRLIFG